KPTGKTVSRPRKIGFHQTDSALTTNHNIVVSSEGSREGSSAYGEDPDRTLDPSLQTDESLTHHVTNSDDRTTPSQSHEDDQPQEEHEPPSVPQSNQFRSPSPQSRPKRQRPSHPFRRSNTIQTFMQRYRETSVKSESEIAAGALATHLQHVFPCLDAARETLQNASEEDDQDAIAYWSTIVRNYEDYVTKICTNLARHLPYHPIPQDPDVALLVDLIKDKWARHRTEEPSQLSIANNLSREVSPFELGQV
ncbi:hypothetical protein BGX27_001066, partial [Mortierella sp. AM989]